MQIVSTTFHVYTGTAPDDFTLLFHAAFANKEESFAYKGTTFDISYDLRQGLVTVTVDTIPKRIPKVFGKRRGLWFDEVCIRARATEFDAFPSTLKPGSYTKPLRDTEGNPIPGVHALADPKGEHEKNEYNCSIVIVWGKEFEQVVEYYNELMTGTLEPYRPLS